MVMSASASDAILRGIRNSVPSSPRVTPGPLV
jgi:hypothetical protein